MTKYSSVFLLICIIGLSSCFNGEVVTLNYTDTLTSTFIFPDSVKSDTTYILTATAEVNPFDILLDSFNVSSSTIDRVAIDTAFIKISSLNNASVNLGFLDSVSLFYIENEDILIGSTGSFDSESEKGFRASDAISLHNVLLNNSLQFKINGITAEDVKDSVFLEFTVNLTITGETE